MNAEAVAAEQASQQQVFTYRRMPPIAPLIVRALATRTRQPGEDDMPPDWRIEVAEDTVNRRQLAYYRKVCGFKPDSHLPLLFPQVMAVTMHMDLMTRDGFPFPMMGLIHMGNVFEQTRPIAVDERMSFSIYTNGAKPSRFGTEFEIVTELHDAAGETPWRSVMTVLQRIQRSKPAPPQPRTAQTLAPIGRKLSSYNLVEAPVDIGRRYALASQEFNPIHLTARTARWLGLPNMLAHGMWTAARCVALLPEPAQGWRRYEVRFRNPLYLPGRAAQRYYTTQQGGYDFALVSDEGNVLLEGWLR